MYKYVLFAALLALASAKPKPLIVEYPVTAYTAPVAAAYTAPVAYSSYSYSAYPAYSAYEYAAPYTYYLR